MERTQEQINQIMRKVKSKDSEIEVLLRKELWKRGLRYRKNVKNICGKPDIVFLSKKVAIFCDSEFWHGFDWENRKKDFKKNREYWIPKIERNIRRDQDVNEKLASEGWTVLRFWGEDIKKHVEECADIIEKVLRKNE
ncbi:MAG: very short patch repair endonuclease [Acetomicrobium sp.]|jgi:DNA mismatch endonuclease (patch repair protein)